ncbi:hypothetical protein SRB17_78650 [Streptomyces sp. RB17]|uniref:hypothetical protein n=1 Tax=Streptomyces sp. RB17 TaxID=2585197 RepID=UPI001296B920|nr:hypothetical protein [Streptomyces sp. RB17]MQY39837.1 hypothetical protein [Streptomyces sp. RB17]
MTPAVRQRGSLLAGVLAAVALVAWFLVGLHHTGQTRSHDSKAAVAASAEHLRARLRDADSDGVLTDHEIDEALSHRRPRSLVRSAARTVLVVQIAASDWARCYSCTALPSGAVSSTPFKECPPEPSSGETHAPPTGRPGTPSPG